MASKTPASKKKSNPLSKTKASSHRPSAQQPNQAAVSASTARDAVQPPKEQQLLLNIFSDAFGTVLSSDRFPTLLQVIKQALYNRDFGTAFGSNEYLETYAARWSPTRALCYSSIFLQVDKFMEQIMIHADEQREPVADEETIREPSESARDDIEGEETRAEPHSRVRMLCIGGCAAEHVAFASYIQSTNCLGSLTLLDSGPWTHVTSLLQHAVTNPPPLSKYASAAAKASNKSLVGPARLDFTFTEANVLDLTEDKLVETVGSQPQMVTLLFTLNELYTDGGIGKTTKFLRTLGKILPAESLLLVVDSPGSYSVAVVGKDKKKYPMQWLLNHTLLESENQGFTWEQLESHDSLWFRMPEGLAYPIQLENMRYQMHLYRIHKT